MSAAIKAFSNIAVIIIASILLYNFVFFVIVVPSASMYPTIDIGDRIITTRIHDASSIERGDILVFYSDELQETMVKRVIGLPNDRVEIDLNGKVFVNNQKLDEAYVKYPDNTSGRYKVPEGEYFFLGDFRDHSFDSRKWENPFIQEDKILGEAKLILFPFDRMSML
ncbi:MAG TPA: signal peptidase I [Clostridia bacterium]|nr:signal peptidase I [Clostridia bacterium]